MTILVDVRHLTQSHPSGVGHYTIQLLRALFDLDTQNRYILLSTGRTPANIETLFPEHADSKQLSHVHIPLPNKLLKCQTILFKQPVFNELVKEPVDLIFLPNLNYTILPEEIPTVMTIHDLSWKLFPSFYSKKMQLWHKLLKPAALIDQTAHIITPSQSTKQDVVHFFDKPESAISVVPHGLDAPFQDHIQPTDHGVRSRHRLPKRFALFIGTLEPRKNLIAAIEAMKSYRERTGDEMSLVLAGSWGWKSQALEKRINQPDVCKWIKVLGYVPDKDRASLYRLASVTLWPSIYEGFGMPVLESMACGTPVITSHTSSLPEVAGGAAILVDPYNHRDIAAALEQLFASQKLQDKLRQKGIEQSRKYLWEKTAEKTLRIFEKNVR